MSGCELAQLFAAARTPSSVPVGGMRMSVSTTSGRLGVDRRDEPVEVLADAHDLDVGIRFEQARRRPRGRGSCLRLPRPGWACGEATRRPVDRRVPAADSLGSRMRGRRSAALLLVVFVALCAMVAGAGPAAAGFTERITNYHSDVTIEPDGTIVVHETIDYDFGVVPHHGIFRDVPVRIEPVGQGGYDRVYPLDVMSVKASEGTPAALQRRGPRATTSASRSAIPTSRSPASTATRSRTACAARSTASPTTTSWCGTPSAPSGRCRSSARARSCTRPRRSSR